MVLASTQPPRAGTDSKDVIFAAKLKALAVPRDSAAAEHPFMKRLASVDTPDTRGHPALAASEEARESFMRDRHTAQLSFGFTPTERSSFVEHHARTARERAREHNLTAQQAARCRQFMTEEEFVAAWTAARSFDPSEAAVAQVVKAFPKQQVSPERSIDATEFAKCCTLDRRTATSVPFPLAYARAARTVAHGQVQAMYFGIFVVLFIIIFVFTRGTLVTDAYHVHNAVNEALAEKLFPMPCEGGACATTAVQTLNFRGVLNRTGLEQWVSERVIPQLWGSSDAQRATQPINRHLYPVGALRVTAVRMASTSPDWKYDQYIGDRGQSAEDAAVVSEFLSRGEGGAARQYKGASYFFDQAGVLKAPFAQANLTGASDLVRGAFEYSPCGHGEDGLFVRGDVASYPCGGYDLILPFNLTRGDALAAWRAVLAAGWVDRHVRGVFVRTVLFSRDTRYFSRSILGFEISTGGYWAPLQRSGVFFFYQARSNIIATVASVLFLIMLALLACVFVHSVAVSVARTAIALGRPLFYLKPSPCAALRSFGVILLKSVIRVLLADLSILLNGLLYLLCVIAWSMRLALWIGSEPPAVYDVVNYPHRMEAYADRILMLGMFDSVTLLLCFASWMRYFRAVRALHDIVESLRVSLPHLLGIVFTGLVLVVAFSLCGRILYGPVLADFSSFYRAMSTILLFVTGEVDYASWDAARPVLAPLFFFLLQTFLGIILLNSITAVIADNFEEVAANVVDEDEIVNALRADETTLLSFDSRTPLSRWPLILHLKTLPRRWFNSAHRLFSRCGGVAEPHWGDGDPALFWMHLRRRLERLYFGTELEAAEALLECWDHVDQLQHRSVPDTDAGLSDPTATLEYTLGVAFSQAPEFGTRSLATMLEEEFGHDRWFVLTLFAYLPYLCIRQTRADEIVRVLAEKVNWRAAIKGTGVLDQKQTSSASIRDSVVRIERTASAMGAVQTTVTFAPDDIAPQQPLHRIVDNLRHIAFYAGAQPPASAASPTPEQQGAWLRRIRDFQRVAGEVGGVPRYDGLWDDSDADLKRLVFGAPPAPNEPIAARAAPKRTPTPWGKKHFDAVLSRCDRSALSCDWSSSDRSAFEAELSDIQRAHLAADAPSTGPTASAIRDTARVPMDVLGAAWKRGLGASLTDERKRYFVELAPMRYGADTYVPRDELLVQCQSHRRGGATRSFQQEFFAAQYQRLSHLVQLFLYVPFLVLLALILAEHYPEVQSYVSLSVHGRSTNFFRAPELRPFSTVADVDQMRAWVKADLVETMLRPGGRFSNGAYDDSNIIVGAIALRQKRVVTDSDCGFPGGRAERPEWQSRVAQYFPESCAPRWVVAQEDKGEFAASRNVSAAAAAAFRHRGCSAISHAEGRVGTYGCSGFTLELPVRMRVDDAKALVDEVFDAGWVTDRTRAVIADVVAFNYNNDLFSRTQFLLEVSAGGAWVPAVRQHVFRAFSVAGFGVGYFLVLALFVVALIASAGHFVFETGRQIRATRRDLACGPLRAVSSFVGDAQNAWVLVEGATYLLLFASLVMRFFLAATSPDVAIFAADRYPDDLITPVVLYYVVSVLDGFAVLVSFARLFHFVRLFPQLNVLTNTLALASSNLVSVLVIGLLLLGTFLVMGMRMYSTSVLSMSTVSAAAESVFMSVLGDADFDTWYRVDPVFAAVYYAAFQVAAVQLLFNMVTGVLAAGYSKAKAQYFNPQVLERIIDVDSLCSSGGSFIVSVLQSEASLMLLRARAVWGTVHPAEHFTALVHNHRTLFHLLSVLTEKFECGSPAEQGIAATGLLLVLRESLGAQLEDDKGTTWAALRGGGPSNLLFGIHRSTVAEYLQTHLSGVDFAGSMAWCVQLPTEALSQIHRGGHEDMVRAVMGFNHLWRDRVTPYLDLEDDEEDSEVQDLDHAIDAVERSVTAMLAVPRPSAAWREGLSINVPGPRERRVTFDENAESARSASDTGGGSAVAHAVRAVISVDTAVRDDGTPEPRGDDDSDDTTTDTDPPPE